MNQDNVVSMVGPNDLAIGSVRAGVGWQGMEAVGVKVLDPAGGALLSAWSGWAEFERLRDVCRAYADLDNAHFHRGVFDDVDAIVARLGVLRADRLRKALATLHGVLTQEVEEQECVNLDFVSTYAPNVVLRGGPDNVLPSGPDSAATWYVDLGPDAERHFAEGMSLSNSIRAVANGVWYNLGVYCADSALVRRIELVSAGARRAIQVCRAADAWLGAQGPAAVETAT